MNNMISSSNIVKTYSEGEEKYKVLNDVTIEIYEGEFVTIMGPSGSGKTSLMFALSGMDAIDSGSILFDHRELSELEERELADLRRNKMGFIFQQPTMIKNLNILDNIILPSSNHANQSMKELTKKAKTLMSKTGISGLEKRNITQVSGGQLQRAGICRALMNNPKIIFGDEPTGALNSKAALEIMKLLLEIHTKGTTMMLVTHDVNVAAHSERILFMQDGSIVSELRLEAFDGNNLDCRVKAVSKRLQEVGI